MLLLLLLLLLLLRLLRLLLASCCLLIFSGHGLLVPGPSAHAPGLIIAPTALQQR